LVSAEPGQVQTSISGDDQDATNAYAKMVNERKALFVTGGGVGGKLAAATPAAPSITTTVGQVVVQVGPNEQQAGVAVAGQIQSQPPQAAHELRNGDGQLTASVDAAFDVLVVGTLREERAGILGDIGVARLVVAGHGAGAELRGPVPNPPVHEPVGIGTERDGPARGWNDLHGVAIGQQTKTIREAPLTRDLDGLPVRLDAHGARVPDAHAETV